MCGVRLETDFFALTPFAYSVQCHVAVRAWFSTGGGTLQESATRRVFMAVGSVSTAVSLLHGRKDLQGKVCPRLVGTLKLGKGWAVLAGDSPKSLFPPKSLSGSRQIRPFKPNGQVNAFLINDSQGTSFSF